VAEENHVKERPGSPRPPEYETGKLDPLLSEVRGAHVTSSIVAIQGCKGEFFAVRLHFALRVEPGSARYTEKANPLHGSYFTKYKVEQDFL
jgi:hypothetical protein